MVQAMTQGKGIPGLIEYFYQHSAHYNELPSLITEAQKSGEAAQGDPDVLALTYISLFQGFTLFLLQDNELKQKITAKIFTNVLRNPGKSK